MIKHNIFLQEFFKITLLKKILFSLCLMFIIYTYIKSYCFDYTIWCMDNDAPRPNNNNQIQNWRRIPIGFWTDLGSIADISINTGISYAAYRGALQYSSILSGSPFYVKAGAFGISYIAIYGARTLFPNNPVNFGLYIGNMNNNNQGNRFNSPLEYGEALNSTSTFMDGMIAINLAILIGFNLLVFILINRTIVPYILKWLEGKLSNGSIIYRIIERSYKVNIKVSNWLIGYIILVIYICMFMDLWGLTRIKIAINMIIENIDIIFNNV